MITSSRSDTMTYTTLLVGSFLYIKLSSDISFSLTTSFGYCDCASAYVWNWIATILYFFCIPKFLLIVTDF
ncbi:uncharacterized protein V2V93DRAFT_372042 [Kockiozyma suomiensis]|uniref:uncharacterized protein n=1 Tax=Kockiozyma suomiensis TaxID=1337062 RepID=UPI003343FD89